ncbi:hypothetical protein [Nostoc sp. DedQUE09]|uniref:hypothetical protein n=1 Tax=Nostoc sp. DedQUE09 TaxID=3075394 RepID=UPI003A102476
MKKLCKIAQLTGALPPRRSGKSSWNVTSRTQWSQFSIPQCFWVSVKASLALIV